VEWFATHSPDGAPVLQRQGDLGFLSNVNAAYRRDCWEQIRFRDVGYAEDQGFATDMLAAGWAKVYHPGARVLHAHDYPPVEFMRRYFDEYRGLRQTIGHVERVGVRSTVRTVRDLTAADRRWMRERGLAPAERARWTGRSLVHHTGRKVFSALGSRAHALPAPVQRAISLEGSAVTPPATVHAERAKAEHQYEPAARVLRDGPAPLAPAPADLAERDSLHIAFGVPWFKAGSGGHNIIFQLILRLERMGHTCSIWVHDPLGVNASETGAMLRRTVVENFAPVQAPVFKEFGEWYGADVAVATGWQTVFPMLELPGVRSRAYLINDHEAEFDGTSVESMLAAETYRQGMYGICGSPWLRDLYVNTYGGRAGVFQYGVDHDVYFPRPLERRRDTVLFYARSFTPRRAVPLGLMALQRVIERRPGLRVVLFGDPKRPDAPFEFEHAGVASPEQLAALYSEATVGMCLSLTNYSLIGQEMLACGLPCVDLRTPSPLSVFGEDGPVELCALHPDSLADAIERLLDDRALWDRHSADGIEFVRENTWDAAAVQVERELRNAVRARV
jgi:O-antigen biosynthesis protein